MEPITGYIIKITMCTKCDELTHRYYSTLVLVIKIIIKFESESVTLFKVEGKREFLNIEQNCP